MKRERLVLLGAGEGFGWSNIDGEVTTAREKLRADRPTNTRQTDPLNLSRK
jgi:hypothetical protein